MRCGLRNVVTMEWRGCDEGGRGDGVWCGGVLRQLVVMACWCGGRGRDIGNGSGTEMGERARVEVWSGWNERQGTMDSRGERCVVLVHRKHRQQSIVLVLMAMTHASQR